MKSLSSSNKKLKLDEEDIQNVIEFSNPSRSICPIRNYPFYLHWSNSQKLTEGLKSGIKSDSSISALNFLKFEEKFEELDSVPIWLRVNNEILPMKLLDIYQTFVGFIHKNKFEEQLFVTQEISFIGPCGPFMQTTLLDIVNQHILMDLLSLKVLKNKLPQRKIRLTTQGKVMV